MIRRMTRPICRQVNPITVKDAYDAYLKGLGSREIEERFGIDYSTLANRWKRNEWPRRNGQPRGQKRQPKADPGSGRAA